MRKLHRESVDKVSSTEGKMNCQLSKCIAVSILLSDKEKKGLLLKRETQGPIQR